MAGVERQSWIQVFTELSERLHVVSWRQNVDSHSFLFFQSQPVIPSPVACVRCNLLHSHVSYIIRPMNAILSMKTALINALDDV